MKPLYFILFQLFNCKRVLTSNANITIFSFFYTNLNSFVCCGHLKPQNN